MNPWFTPGNISFALNEISRLLERDRMEKWLASYAGRSFDPPGPLQVGTVLAGNIPLAGFHDFLCILLSGSRFTGRLSGKDDKLLPFLADRLITHCPDLGEFIRFTDGKLGKPDAIIATGSNNTSRYFDYYFGRYPHIFRKNRNGVAVLTGRESEGELSGLADDIFLYFGLGCRNVAKMYVPQKYDFDVFFSAMEKYAGLTDHNKYANNYQFYRSVYLMNRVKHLDNGFLILKRGKGFSSPVGTLFYDYYRDTGSLEKELGVHNEKIQCVVAPGDAGIRAVPPGMSQRPEPWDYADDMDTLIFLSNLYEN